MLLGFHVSIRKGFKAAVGRALERESDCLQIFSRSPRSWHRPKMDARQVESFRKARMDARLRPLVVHTPYLLNLCSSSRSLREKSKRHLLVELSRAKELGAEMVVTHVGGSETPSRDDRRLVSAIEWVLSRTPKPCQLLLENAARPSDGLGSSLQRLCQVVEASDPRVGLCLDVAHAFQAGYEIRFRQGLDAALGEMEGALCAGRLRLLHLNDSKTPLGSGLDRHERIGFGRIGLAGFRTLLSTPGLWGFPGILETPGATLEEDLPNIRVLRSLLR